MSYPGTPLASLLRFDQLVPLRRILALSRTGGSSGSPVLNGRGELVGINFDPVWENVANDFGWNQDVGRIVAVDVRYLLWAMRPSTARNRRLPGSR